MQVSSPDEILSYWLDDVGPSDWYSQSDKLDSAIQRKYLNVWESARAGAFPLWLTYPSGVLAYIILTDQFPRNMFRGLPNSFILDSVALAAANNAILKG